MTIEVCQVDGHAELEERLPKAELGPQGERQMVSGMAWSESGPELPHSDDSNIGLPSLVVPEM